MMDLPKLSKSSGRFVSCLDIPGQFPLDSTIAAIAATREDAENQPRAGVYLLNADAVLSFRPGFCDLIRATGLLGVSLHCEDILIFVSGASILQFGCCASASPTSC